MESDFSQYSTLLKQSDIFSEFDIRFAEFIHRLSDKKAPEIFFTALLLSLENSKGHVCIDLEDPEDSLSQLSPEITKVLSPAVKWHDIIMSSSVTGKPGDFCPFILDGSLLYLHKYWNYENKIADRLISLASKQIPLSDPGHFLKLIDQYFPEQKGTTDWQRVAACIASLKQLCVITGGPGTGKTSTVIRIIALLSDLFSNNSPALRIAFTAPTGKAAARMEDALHETDFSIKSDKVTISTIHRLLGPLPEMRKFRHNSQNPLHIDIAVIDEASMIDISLMAKFLDALPEKSRLILVGDRDQLASVQAGSVLSDICSRDYLSLFSASFLKTIEQFNSIDNSFQKASDKAPVLSNCTVELKKNYRFSGAVAQCASAIKEGKAEEALSCISLANTDSISLTDIQPGKTWLDKFRQEIISGWHDYCKAESIAVAFNAFGRFRVLCALRSGPFGVENLNPTIESILKKAGLLNPESRWYFKRPVMITRNDYNLNLYNGDTGIIMPDIEADGNLKAWFPNLSGNEKDKFRSVSPSRLPSHKTGFAITVHKSQGSEFNSVLLFLPNQDSRVLTRELIYTAITRTRSRISIFANDKIIRSSILKRIERKSGLRNKLYS